MGRGIRYPFFNQLCVSEQRAQFYRSRDRPAGPCGELTRRSGADDAPLQKSALRLPAVAIVKWFCESYRSGSRTHFAKRSTLSFRGKATLCHNRVSYWKSLKTMTIAQKGFPNAVKAGAVATLEDEATPRASATTDDCCLILAVQLEVTSRRPGPGGRSSDRIYFM
ncbi:hypothetical protein EVAR_65795_1 [Eumeta japonica]|uniref:Uncharacterized protein n=1 Tax=Eumeta variegata TaxID=151549 RepID=A0A4C1ZUV7_EUMVA|nr:hypothetical protein EVAR_65795_1 [Eumeta japonica]